MAQIMRRAEKDEAVRINELARKTGMDKSTISRIMSGKAMPSLPTAKKIADGIGLSLDELHDRLERLTA